METCWISHTIPMKRKGNFSYLQYRMDFAFFKSHWNNLGTTLVSPYYIDSIGIRKSNARLQCDTKYYMQMMLVFLFDIHIIICIYASEFFSFGLSAVCFQFLFRNLSHAEWQVVSNIKHFKKISLSFSF